MERRTNYLIHHGVKGQEWGERNYQYEDGSLTPLGRDHYGVGKPRTEKEYQKMLKKDMIWARKHQKKIEKIASSRINKSAIREFEKGLSKQMKKFNKDGSINANYATAYSKVLADAYNRAIGDIKVDSGTESGRVVRFITQRGSMKLGIAVADPGADMSMYKNGVFKDGRVGYSQNRVGTVDVSRKRRK